MAWVGGVGAWAYSVRVVGDCSVTAKAKAKYRVSPLRRQSAPPSVEMTLVLGELLEFGV